MKPKRKFRYNATLLFVAVIILFSRCKKEEIDNTVRDIDGNTYKIVKIGNQVWMAENLRTTRHSDGSVIPNVTDNGTWAGLITPAYCWYNNDQTTFANEYGALYNWYAVSTGKLCPTGWRVPTDAEWEILVGYAGGASVAGGKLKSTRTAPDAHPRWESPNTGATDQYRFSALPGGIRSTNGTFNTLEYLGRWWSATESSSSDAFRREIDFANSNVFRNNSPKEHGFSVRCIRD